jgi:hypothetical protein
MRRLDPATVLIPFVYFIAGATTLAGVAATFFYKETLQLSIVQTQLLASIAIVPWSIKPLYGLLSDRCPIWGLRRKPYLVAAGLLGSLGYLGLGTVVMDFRGAMTASIVAAIGFALADVTVDAIVAERSRNQREAGRLQSICRASLMAGAIAVAYLSGVLVEVVGARNVFLITAVLPLCTAAIALGLSELPSPQESTFSLRETWQRVRGALTPGLLWAVLFLFVWRSTPTSGGAFSYFLIDELHFEPEFFGRLSLLSHLSAIVGIVVFRRWLLALSIKTLLVGVVLASIVLSLPALGLVYGWYELLGLPPQAFAVADTLVSGALTEIGFLPLLVLAARLCPRGIEATVFALLASIMNIGLAVSDLGGAALVSIFDVTQATDTTPANYANLHIVLWIAILSSALPLSLLPWVPETRSAEERLPEPSPSMVTAGPTTMEGKEEAVV